MEKAPLDKKRRSAMLGLLFGGHSEEAVLAARDTEDEGLLDRVNHGLDVELAQRAQEEEKVKEPA